MKIPIITGPTATGKSQFALKLSKYVDIEIINADAFQVYKYMDIGTAKPSKEDQETCPHHLIDILTPNIQYNVGIFFNLCETLIPEILNRKRLPVIVGGTGLYVEAIYEGMCEVSARDKNIYATLVSECETFGLDKMYEKLMLLDKEYAKKISHNDKKRILRGLEAYYVTKMPISELHKKFHKKLNYDFEIYVFNLERTILYEKIDKRVDKMFDNGFVNEVKMLLDMGFDEKCPGFKAIGYREIAEYLTSGGDLEKVVKEIQKKTRNFAKRQLTWFRHMKNVNFLNLNECDKSNILTEFIKKFSCIN
jgi:tRNA dimethylallyltransferase